MTLPPFEQVATEAATPGAAEHCGFDLSEFDAETTHLHLEITAAHVLQLPRVVPPRQGPRSDTFDPPKLPNGSGRNRTEVNAGFPRYPRVT